ncbi:CHAT domain-containing protein [Spirosoma utsteinense]|uniref:CHAT domain-containing protein n=1 Tax=Spirosoma utsteinense TaxID=2585773 RepID=UPI00164951A0|nr:CHAT domain-containing protein [Spirosoma utsteinense]MBC3785273.1 CHAT domain-containing protein [Spirosoma utsteinense]
MKKIAMRPIEQQYQPLDAWLTQWDHCGYEKDSIYVNALLQAGQALLVNDNLPVAVQLVRRAISACQHNLKTTRVADLSKAWYRLGVLYTYQNQITQATNALKQAVVIGRHDPLATNWVSNAHLYLAYGYETAGDFQQTIVHADLGIPMAIRLNNKPLAANLLRQKAQALSTLQAYDLAQQAIEKAIGLIEKEEQLKQALADDYSLLSLILGYKYQYRQALKYAQFSFDLSQRLRYSETPTLAIRLAFLYKKTGQYAEAIHYCQYGIDQSADVFVKAVGLNMMATVYWEKKQFDKALPFYQQGMELLPIGFGKQPVARNPQKEQIRLVEHKGILLDLIQDKADTWLEYAKATNNNHQQLQHALATYKVADQLIDYMRWEHTGQQSKLYWRQKTRGMYERAIETCYRLGDTDQAFRFFEKSRAVMLADKLNELGARQQLSPQLAEQEDKLRKAVSEQQAKLTESKPNTTAYANNQSALIAQQDKLDDFHRQLERTNPAYFQYKYASSLTSVADLQRYLKIQRASFVTYFEGDSALYLLGVTANKVTLQRKPVAPYSQAVRPFMNLLADPEAMNHTSTVARFTTVGNTLYKQLLASLNVPAGRVIVSPDGSLIPFEALSRSAVRLDYLVKSYAFSYAYSAHLLLREEPGAVKPARVGTGDFLGVAPVSFAPRLGQVKLAGSDKALDPIAGRFGTSMLLTHEAATRRAFQAEVSAYRVIHLFTHATADTTGQEPTLYFADSTLRLSDLGDGALPNAQLVVLAACKTGIGAIQRGEGVFSLARGFSALGVPSVLTTLWSVQNDATYRLTDSFYRYLDQGLSKDVALQQAKKDWLENADGANQLPNYWAGLILIGDTNPLERPTRWPWVAIGAVLFLAAGLLSWWHLKRQAVPTLSLSQLS